MPSITDHLTIEEIRDGIRDETGIDFLGRNIIGAENNVVRRELARAKRTIAIKNPSPRDRAVAQVVFGILEKHISRQQEENRRQRLKQEMEAEREEQARQKRLQQQVGRHAKRDKQRAKQERALPRSSRRPLRRVVISPRLGHLGL